MTTVESSNFKADNEEIKIVQDFLFLRSTINQKGDWDPESEKGSQGNTGAQHHKGKALVIQAGAEEGEMQQALPFSNFSCPHPPSPSHLLWAANCGVVALHSETSWNATAQLAIKCICEQACSQAYFILNRAGVVFQSKRPWSTASTPQLASQGRWGLKGVGVAEICEWAVPAVLLAVLCLPDFKMHK